MLRWISAALVVALFAPSIVQAQGAWGPSWLVDRSRREGPGFQLGSLELHPGLGVEAGYDSNVFLDDSGGPVDLTSSAIIRITPHLDISTSNTQREQEGETSGTVAPKLEFRAGISGELYIFLADEARNNVGLNGNLDLNVFPKGRFGFRLTNDFQRRVRPFAGRQSGGNFAIDTNQAGLRFTGRSRGGNLSAGLGYTFGIQHFENTNFRYLDNFQHQFSADTHWRFFPNTSLFWDGNLTFTDYRNAGSAVALNLSNTYRLSTRVGLNGVVTPKFSMTAAVGYGAVFVADDSLGEQETLIASLGLRFRPTATTQIGLGYDRITDGSLVGNFQTSDRLHAKLQWLMGGSFLLAFDSSLAFINFGDVVDSTGMPISVDGSTDRKDIMLTMQLFAEYRFTSYLGVNLTFGYTGNYTDFEYQLDIAGMGTVPDPASFNKFDAWLGVRIFY